MQTIQQLKTLETIVSKGKTHLPTATQFILIKQEEGQLEYVATNGLNLCVLKNEEKNSLTEFFLKETQNKNILISKDAMKVLKNIKKEDDVNIYIESLKHFIVSENDELRFPDYKTITPSETLFEAVKINNINSFFDAIRVLQQLGFYGKFQILQDKKKERIFIKTNDIAIISMN